MTTSIFKTKEQYFTFRKSWSSAVNNDKAKPPVAWLHASHHILFNLLCNKPFDNGFTPITNINKLKNGTYLNHGLYYAMVDLKYMQSIAKKIGAGNKFFGKKPADYEVERLREFFAPLSDTITDDMVADIVNMLATLELPTVAPLYSNYGKSKQVADKIINGEFKPNNFAQIYTAVQDGVFS